MGEISPGSTSYTLTELLHAVNMMIYWTGLAKITADAFVDLGLHIDSSGWVYQNLQSEDTYTESEE